MLKNKYLGNKPYINIGTIGCKDYGKTSLTAAIIKYCSLNTEVVPKSYRQINKGTEEKIEGISIFASHVEYETLNNHYSHFDCPEYSDYVKGIISGIIKMDAAILVVSANEMVISQIEEYISLARQTGISNIIVFINKCDDVECLELLELIEIEVRDILNKNGFSGDTTRVIYGSALKVLESKSEDKSAVEYKCIADLLETMDTIITPVKSKDEPFLMPIEDVFDITGKGTVVTGKIERGCINKGDEIEIVGIHEKTKKTVITCIETFRKVLESAEAGSNVGIFLKDIKKEDIQKGQVIAKPDSALSYTEFEAEVYILTNKEYGRSSPFFQGYRPRIYFETIDLAGTIELPKDKKIVTLGDRVTMRIKLNTLIVMEKGLRFSIRECERTVGFGIVSNVIK